MIPNAWFYKLKDMSTKPSRNSSHPKKTQSLSSSSNKHHPPHLSQPPRQSFYYTWESSSNTTTRTDQKLMNSSSPPRKSSSKRKSRRRKTIYKPSPKRAPAPLPLHCKCRRHGDYYYFDSSTDDIDFLKSPASSEFESDNFDGLDSFNGLASRSSTFSSSATDIIIDVNDKKLDLFNSIPELDLPRILTKPIEIPKESANLKEEEEEQMIKTRKSISGIKIRANSPKLAASKKIITEKKKKKKKALLFSDSSFAVVKASIDPQKDFRESMMEMIVENNIRASKDLEELLACYLSLNSDEYHELIIKAFEQIWFNLLPDLQL